jgi:hypothetical protein
MTARVGRTERLAGCQDERGVRVLVRKEPEELDLLESRDSLIEMDSLKDMRWPKASFSGAVIVLYTCAHDSP